MSGQLVGLGKTHGDYSFKLQAHGLNCVLEGYEVGMLALESEESKAVDHILEIIVVVSAL